MIIKNGTIVMEYTILKEYDIWVKGPDIYEAIACQKSFDALQESSEKKTWITIN